MKISATDVEHVAKLARLQITAGEKDKFTNQINDILLYIEKLNELNTKGIAPMSQAAAGFNAFREDKIAESLGAGQALVNAPDARGDFFRVPKVID